jgi:hypothetical protein
MSSRSGKVVPDTVRLAPFALFALLSVACGGRTANDYDRALAESRRASSAGRFGEASEAYARAARGATKERDRDHAALLSALEKARAGDVALALRELDVLAKRTPSTRASEEAAYKAADLRRKTGAVAEGLAAMEAFLVAHPDSPFAYPALSHVVRAEEGDTSDARATAARGHALLGRLAEKVPAASPIGQRIAYERAARTEPREAKVQAYVALANRFPYPTGAYWDDSLFAAANLEVEAGHPNEAVALLSRLLAQRETSDVIGTYQRPKYTPAKLRIAEIQAQQLNDRAAARTTLHELYTTFTASDRRDDALWAEAKLFREDHMEDEACSVLRTLVSDFPDSRYVPCVVASCPRASRPKKSRAPITCHAYLTRDVAGTSLAPAEAPTP